MLILKFLIEFQTGIISEPENLNTRPLPPHGNVQTAIRCIIGMPTLMDMGPAVIDLAAGRIICPNYDDEQRA